MGHRDVLRTDLREVDPALPMERVARTPGTLRGTEWHGNARP